MRMNSQRMPELRHRPRHRTDSRHRRRSPSRGSARTRHGESPAPPSADKPRTVEPCRPTIRTPTPSPPDASTPRHGLLAAPRGQRRFRTGQRVIRFWAIFLRRGDRWNGTPDALVLPTPVPGGGGSGRRRQRIAAASRLVVVNQFEACRVRFGRDRRSSCRTAVG